jgi:hypothetical protein
VGGIGSLVVRGTPLPPRSNPKLSRLELCIVVDFPVTVIELSLSLKHLWPDPSKPFKRFAPFATGTSASCVWARFSQTQATSCRTSRKAGLSGI